MATPQKNPEVTFVTNLGEIKVELYQEKAPKTVENFLSYVKENFYKGTIFHRVIPGFMIQGGGFNEAFDQKPTKPQIKNEAANGLKNEKGTLAMARTQVVDSATAQFFINTVNNDFLDFRAPTPSGFGYCVFGKVIAGMDVVEKIEKVKTTTKEGHQNVPVTNVVILDVLL
jgi:peptidyl-prolyl cis-trans isomerase B (cyclophilin B)